MTTWSAPTAHAPVSATVELPGSKSITNRALVLAALADAPSTITGALRSRDTDLMIDGLAAMGTGIAAAPDDPSRLTVTPRPLHGAAVQCGLAGTVMRFLPPVAAVANGTVEFDGDPQARTRPLHTILDALRELGADITGTALPFTVAGAGSLHGGDVVIDGFSHGRSPPLREVELPAGRHHVQVRHGNAPPFDVRVNLEPGERMTVTHTFTAERTPPKPGGFWRDLRRQLGF